jgi:hypothetical protein
MRISAGPQGRCRPAPASIQRADRLARVNTVGGQGKSGEKPARSRHCDRVEDVAGALRQPLGRTPIPREGAAAQTPEARRPVPGQP